MSLPAYFISDLHLGCNPQHCIADREERIIALLRSWQGQASHIFLVGDVFEFWMEYRDYVNRHHFGLLRALAELVESGVTVHYLSGNHDFRLDDFFPKTLGVQVHSCLNIELQGLRIWMQHGDGCAKSDWKYRWASKIIHSPINVFLFRLLHPDWGMSLARLVGHTSRTANEGSDQKLAEYQVFAQNVLLREHCDAVVLGHNHLGGIWDLDAGQLVNCGQWLFELSYIELRDGVFRHVVIAEKTS
jgi:UDP-2,3-diacylglucosamine hydrolase